MLKRVIPTSEGKMIEVTEGELSAPSPEPTVVKPKRQRAKSKARKKSRSSHNRPKGKYKRPDQTTNHNIHEKCKRIPGYHEWWKGRVKQIVDLFNKPGMPTRKRMGVPDGIRKEHAARLWAKAKLKAKEDMANIKKVMPDLLDERAEEALVSTLEVMRSPMNQSIKLAAARQVLEWTKAKPAAKSEMTVNAAEAWLASIADDAKDA